MWTSKESIFLRRNLLLVKTLTTVERATKDLEYCTADQAAAGFEKTDSSCKKVLRKAKSYQTMSQSTRKLFMIEEPLDGAHFTAVFFEETATATLTFSNHHPAQSGAINIQARLSISKIMMH